MKENGKAKKALKTVAWVCDKTSCRHTNTRRIPLSNVINDDTCDNCNCRIHEPITKTVKDT